MKTLNESALYQAIKCGPSDGNIPSSIFFELTYGCNFRCAHCYNPTHWAKPEELSANEIFCILDQVAALGVLSVAFTGGEMFTRPDIFEIFEHAKRLGLVLDILTNASFLTEAAVAKLEELGIQDIAVSMYGATEATFERVTRTSGSYKLFLQGLEALSKSSSNICVRMPLMTINVHEAKMAKTFVERKGFLFRFYLGIDPRQDGDPRPLQYQLDPGTKIAVLSELQPEGLRKTYLKEKTCSPDFIDCACGREQFAITSYGKMNLCVSFPTPNYDLRLGTVKEGWRILQKLVQDAKPNDNYYCSSCDLKPFCQQGRADAWMQTGDMSACLPHFKEYAMLHKKEFQNRVVQ
ncbi:MAG: hypothetical protein AUJ72_00840 [Candidatus Omnitrophica bacterium CG1_02_46_14]|nr:MAG: hypothetical protein AUJ72_00840 [Candidatus Omnitrophica bacterium CG1_02_46_14]